MASVTLDPGDVVEVTDQSDSNYERSGPVVKVKHTGSGDNYDIEVWMEDHRRIYQNDQVDFSGRTVDEDVMKKLPDVPLVQPG